MYYNAVSLKDQAPFHETCGDIVRKLRWEKLLYKIFSLVVKKKKYFIYLAIVSKF